MQEVLNFDLSEDQMQHLASSALMDSLSQCGNDVIGAIEARAPNDKRLMEVLGYVWRKAMSDEVWSRIVALRGHDDPG